MACELLARVVRDAFPRQESSFCRLAVSSAVAPQAKRSRVLPATPSGYA